MPLSPNAVYFDYSAAKQLKTRKYKAVINLSHREEALALAGALETERLLGPYRNRQGAMHIAGAWQLYRASLTYNNRHNHFHWADLNGLDLLNARRLLRTVWPRPRNAATGKNARIGLFLGASEAAKRPDDDFWAGLAGRLLQAGQRPVLLGGEAEKSSGRTVAAKLGAPALDLCGRFSIKELAEFIAGLDLLVTPDTGPMHVAVWTGTPVLNLSLGPVSPWETGPFAPGHHVLRAKLSCTGCWHCTCPSLLCKASFSPRRTASLIHQLVSGRQDALAETPLPGQELRVTQRDRHGLFRLAPLLPDPASHRDELGIFWQIFFGTALGFLPRKELDDAWRHWSGTAPTLVPVLAKGLTALSRSLSEGVRKGGEAGVHGNEFWRMAPPLLHPLSSYVHLLLQNTLYSRNAYAQALELVETLAALPR
jgi:ADP-heptose:LPS heptosyltransferase